MFIEAGLIACRREGQFVYSQTVLETIAAYTQALANITRGKKGSTASPTRANQSEERHGNMKYGSHAP
jgi:hypothetical protein